MAYLYRHIRNDIGKVFYIGVSTKPKRAYDKHNRSNFWKNIVSKTDYSIEIMLEDDNFEFIKEKEKEFILLYGRANLGLGTLVNLTDGGEGSLGHKHTEEHKLWISSILKLRCGEKATWYGKKHSEETKVKMSEIGKLRTGALTSNYGKRIPDDVRLKISIANSGKKRTPEQCKRISIAKTNPNKIPKVKKGLLRGPEHHFFGKKNEKFSEYLRLQVGEKSHKSKKIINIETNEVFVSVIEASKICGINYSTLRSNLRADRKNNTSFRYI